MTPYACKMYGFYRDYCIHCIILCDNDHLRIWGKDKLNKQTAECDYCTVWSPLILLTVLLELADLHVRICKMPIATLTVFNLLGCIDVSQKGHYCSVGVWW